MGTIVELLSDKVGIIWPKSASPFNVHLISIGEESILKKAEKLYEKMTEAGVEVLFDDRDARAGEKFADSDLIGIPVRVVISEKTLKEDGVEIKIRGEEKSKIVSEKELFKIING